ncbi:MAG: NADH dehydrogenase FAD-containing subunit [Candidatus Schekmanbacteria bacterium]|nr:NADH dehydrogenase FAD-containing subunit [Candidatus Schekmanbacteria bacterium]
MIVCLVLVPAIAGVISLAIRSDALRRGLLIVGAAAHTLLTLAAWIRRPAPELGGWIALDGPGLLFLSITSCLFLMAALYSVGYLDREVQGRRQDFEEAVAFSNAPEARFTGSLLLFHATMTMVAVSQHFGILWVAVEATTLVSAPLIYFHRHHRSLEATWKYLLVCSVGIALALLGNIFLVVAASRTGSGQESMLLAELVKQGPRLDIPWLKAAFLFFLVGYGTKMGLAPMHTWLPDAHSESPSVVSALLSGALLNCAFLAILRAQQVCAAAGQAGFGQELLVLFGLLSMAFAAVFILRQTDYKRLLAYSSVEHVGILALGVGLGGAASLGAMLHAVNHSLTKAMLFLVAGNILAAYRTKSIAEVGGILRGLPISGVLWVAGFLAITGSPPFGPFLSELTILKGALDQGRGVIAVFYLALLALIFVGMATAVLPMAQGRPQKALLGGDEPGGATPLRLGSERVLAVVPPALLGIGVLVLGLYVPPVVLRAVHEASQAVGGW